MVETVFEPRRHLRRVHLQGQTVDYLDVKWRLVWLRTEQPDAQITTEHVQITPERAVFRATVTIPGGGSATGYGSGDDVEAAESAALGRALLALGYGTAYAPDHVLAAEPASPVPSSPASAPATAPARPTPPTTPGDLPPGVTVGPGGTRALPPKLAAIFAQAQPIVDAEEVVEEATSSPPPPPPLSDAVEVDSTRSRPTGVRERPPAPAQAAPPRSAGQTGPPPPAMPPVRKPETPARELPSSLTGRAAEPPRPAPAPPARSVLGRASADPDDDDAADAEGHQADTDWSAFWPWARSRGYFNRDDIEKAIGQPIRNRTPREIRTLILNLEDV